MRRKDSERRKGKTDVDRMKRKTVKRKCEKDEDRMKKKTVKEESLKKDEDGRIKDENVRKTRIE